MPGPFYVPAITPAKKRLLQSVKSPFAVPEPFNPADIPQDRIGAAPAGGPIGLGEGISQGLQFFKGFGQQVQTQLAEPIIRSFSAQNLPENRRQLPPARDLPETLGRAAAGFIGAIPPQTVDDLAKDPKWLQAVQAVGFIPAGAVATGGIEALSREFKVGQDIVRGALAKVQGEAAPVAKRILAGEAGRVGKVPKKPITKPIAPVTKPAAPGGEPVEAIRKQPWEMTQKEFISQAPMSSGAKAAVSPIPEGLSPALADRLREAQLHARKYYELEANAFQAQHRGIVFDALQEGKPVPPEVLADYPDLAAAIKPAARPGEAPQLLTGPTASTAEAVKVAPSPTSKVAGEVKSKLSLEEFTKHVRPGRGQYGISFEGMDITPPGMGVKDFTDRERIADAYKRYMTGKLELPKVSMRPEQPPTAPERPAQAVHPPVPPETRAVSSPATIDEIETRLANLAERRDSLLGETHPSDPALANQLALLDRQIENAQWALREVRQSTVRGKPRPHLAKLQGAVAPEQPPTAPERPAEAVVTPRATPRTATPADGPPVKPPVATGATPPTGGGDELNRIQGMLQTKKGTPTDWRDVALKAQEYANDSYYGLRRFQGRIQKTAPILPGSQRDIITGITNAPGAPNAGYTRYTNTLDEMKRIAPGANVVDLNAIIFSEHGKEILAAKGAERVLPGGVNTAAGLDKALTDLEARMGSAEYAKAHNAAEVVKQVYATERQRLVESGLISQELGDALAKEYPWYNPLRYLDYVDEEASRGRTVSPLSVSSSGLRRLSEVGSEKAIVPPLETLGSELVRNEVRIRKNDLAKGIVKLGLEDPTLGITKRKITVPVAQVEGEPIFRPQHGEIPGTLSFMEGGTRQVYDVPDWMYREAAVLNQSISNPVASMIGALNGISRAAFTTFSPVFTVANVMNDMLPALVRGGVLPTDTARRLALSFRSLEKDPLMQAYGLSGALQARFYGKDAAEVAKLAGATGGKVIGKNFNLKKAVLDAIPDLGARGEQAPRQAVFEKNLNKTLPEWRTMTPEQIAATPQARKAAADAVEATINFGRGGYLIRSANPFVIFLNASMEGTKLPFRALRESSRAKWTLAGLAGGVAGLTAYNMSYPEYFDVPDRTRWGSVMIMLPSKRTDLQGKVIPRYLTIIPNTREWASFFAPLTYGMEKAAKDNPEGFGQFAGAMIPQVSPVSNIPIPQVLNEVAQQAANYDFYQGQPIVSQSKANLPTTEQTGPYVSSAVERGAQALGLSPLRVAHAIQAIFGGAGAGVTSALDMAVGAKNQHGLDLKAQYDALAPEKRAAWLNKLKSADRSALNAAESQAKQQVPVISSIAARFLHERGGQQEQNDWARFDKTVADTNKAFASIPGMKELGVRLGSVGRSLDMVPGTQGGEVKLSPAQMADFQTLTASTVIGRLTPILANPVFQKLPQEKQVAYLQARIIDLRARARGEFRATLRRGGVKPPSQQATAPSNTPTPRQQTTPPTPTPKVPSTGKPKPYLVGAGR